MAQYSPTATCLDTRPQALFTLPAGSVQRRRPPSPLTGWHPYGVRSSVPRDEHEQIHPRISNSLIHKSVSIYADSPQTHFRLMDYETEQTMQEGEKKQPSIGRKTAELVIPPKNSTITEKAMNPWLGWATGGGGGKERCFLRSNPFPHEHEPWCEPLKQARCSYSTAAYFLCLIAGVLTAGDGTQPARTSSSEAFSILMGKKVKAKPKNLRKAQERGPSASSSDVGPGDAASQDASHSAEETTASASGREHCGHYSRDSAHLDKVLLEILSSKHVASCEHCREDAPRKKGGAGSKEKGGKKKKGGASKGAAAKAQAKAERSDMWVCLDCGRHFCGGAVEDTKPYGHSRRHAKQDRHWWAARYDDPTVAYCLSCEKEVSIEMPKIETVVAAVVDDKVVGIEDPDASGLVNPHANVIKGLPNLGNTCFFNAVLQNLLALDRLRRKMLGPDVPTGALAMSLKKLFAETSASNHAGGALSPKNLFSSICSKYPQFRGYQMQDSHELLRCFLDGLRTEETEARKLVEEASDAGVPTIVDSIFGDSTGTGQIWESRDAAHGPLHPQDDAVPKEQILGSEHSGENTVDDAPLLQPVILLPYKEFGTTVKERDETIENSQNSECAVPPPDVSPVTENNTQPAYGGDVEQDDYGFGDMFNEPEVTSEVKKENGKAEDIDVMAWSSNSADDEVDDSNAPVSVEGCLALYTEPELLSEPWLCEHCTNAARLSADEAKNVVEMTDGAEIKDGEEMMAGGDGRQDDTENATIQRTGAVFTVEKTGPSNSQTDHKEQSVDLRSLELESSSLNKQQHDVNIQYNDGHNVDITAESTSAPVSCDSDSVSCSATNNVEAEHVGGAEEVVSSCLPSDAQQTLQSAKDSEDVITRNQGRRKRMKMVGKAQQMQDSQNKKKEDETKVFRAAMRRILISKAPPVLTNNLNRFSQDSHGRYKKLKGHVRFKEMLDIQPFMDPRCKENNNTTYRLVGVVEHLGTMTGGHYIAYVRAAKIGGRQQQSSSSKSWFYASDGQVREASLEEVLNFEAYILFYERVAD
ncbi:ubiquitin carboxyl-terminal hydrolase 2-like [Panicum miliaceum]|uniref:Ubiquitin carboxyl-terminal hydrolase 2-like n=1 Tax=Panicum miliaceum TaxID=4540 RepID=A0A3L6QTU6_PANMI|nr:ubiquitin carboxyl-terminal hydrolase 2-like [Panicum miliaceum]